MKIFRKVRQGLLTENKFSKYLLYAIGEIVLIVIGILIALSINNLNEQRIIREKEQLYLIGLKSEFEASKVKLQNLIKVNKLNYEGAKKIAEFINNPQSEPDEKQLSELLYNSFAFEISYNPNNSLLKEMINSGSLKDVSNSELKVYLTSWESLIESIRRQESGLREQREKMIDIFLSNNGSIRTIFDQTNILTREMGLKKSKNYFSNLKLLKSRDFENNILLYILTGISTESVHYKPLLDDINKILELINGEINIE